MYIWGNLLFCRRTSIYSILSTESLYKNCAIIFQIISRINSHWRFKLHRIELYFKCNIACKNRLSQPYPPKKRENIFASENVEINITRGNLQFSLLSTQCNRQWQTSQNKPRQILTLSIFALLRLMIIMSFSSKSMKKDVYKNGTAL